MLVHINVLFAVISLFFLHVQLLNRKWELDIYLYTIYLM